MPINEANFLRWEGAFTESPYINKAVDNGPILFTSGSYTDIDVLANDEHTYPISELNIISYTWAGKTPKWTGTHIRVFAPNSFTGSGILKYQFTDVLGRKSNIASVYINFVSRTGYWLGYLPSAYCEVTGSGQNTGMLIYSQRQQFYTDNNQPVLPIQLEANNAGPNYISPINDPATCPIPSQLFIPIYVVSEATYIDISTITIKKTGFADVVISANITYPGSGIATAAAFPFPYHPTGYDDIIITYNQNVSDISSKKYLRTIQPSGPVVNPNFPAGSIGLQNLSLGSIVLGIQGLSFIAQS